MESVEGGGWLSTQSKMNKLKRRGPFWGPAIAYIMYEAALLERRRRKLCYFPYTKNTHHFHIDQIQVIL